MQTLGSYLIVLMIFGFSSVFVGGEQFNVDGSTDAPDQEEIKTEIIDMVQGPFSNPKCADVHDWCYKFENIKTNYADNIESPISIRSGDTIQINSNIFQSGEKEEGTVDIIFFVVDPDNKVKQFPIETRKTFNDKNLEPLTLTFTPEKKGLHKLYLAMTSPDFNNEHIFDKIAINVIVEDDISFIIVIIAVVLIGFLILIVYRKVQKTKQGSSPFKPIED